MSLSVGAGLAISGLIAALGAGGSAGASAISNRKSLQYQKQLLNMQFLGNKWLAEHAHQMEVSDLRKAGLNPVLSANNGASSSVGLASAPSSNLDFSLGNSLSDAVNTTMQNINSAKSVDSQIKLNDASEGLITQQSLTEANKRNNLDSQTNLNNVIKSGKEIENLWLPESIKTDLRYKNDMAKASVISANANNANASANMINATTGNPTKIISDIVNNPSKYYKNIVSGAKSLGKAMKNDFINLNNKHNSNMLNKYKKMFKEAERRK